MSFESPLRLVPDRLYLSAARGQPHVCPAFPFSAPPLRLAERTGAIPSPAPPARFRLPLYGGRGILDL